MSVVDELRHKPDLLSNAGRTGEIVRYAVRLFANFCELGSVSPDLPFLDIFHRGSKGWGNVMHYWKTADIIRNGVAWFATRDMRDPNTQRALSWLFGYAAHVATDLTVHPVLVASGYAFATNPSGHRQAELHQDAYIFRKLHGAEAADVSYIENCGIASCGDPDDPDKVHPAIRELWRNCLADISPDQVQFTNGATPLPTGSPAPDAWYHDYTTRQAEFAELGGGFVFFFRDVIEEIGLSLPASQKVDVEKYIKNLKTPTGESTNYDEVFSIAQDNVHRVWRKLCVANDGRNRQLFALENADLDTGLTDGDHTQISLA